MDSSKLDLDETKVTAPVLSKSTTVSAPKKMASKVRTESHAYAAALPANGKRLRHRSNKEALSEAFKPNSEFYRSTESIGQELSAQCRRILADTGIETATLRSPTVTANVTSDYDYGFGASYDFIDLKRANLKEELALARCYRSSLSIKLTQLLVTSPQSSTRAGYLARAETLRRGRKEFASVGRAISGGLSNGSLTVSRATILRQHLSQAKSAEARARSEASRRVIVDRLLSKNFKSLDSEILIAERRVHDTQERMRTTDVFKLRGSISYNIHNQEDPSIVRNESSGVTGKLKLSIRLGALSERRHRLEQISREARVDGYYEAEQGAFWRSAQIVRSNKMMISGLKKQRSDILRALAQARRNTTNPGVEFEEELLPARIRGRIDVLTLKATLAGIDATMADIGKMNSKLRFKR